LRRSGYAAPKALVKERGGFGTGPNLLFHFRFELAEALDRAAAADT
jgi:hypothetical protein